MALICACLPTIRSLLPNRRSKYSKDRTRSSEAKKSNPPYSYSKGSKGSQTLYSNTSSSEPFAGLGYSQTETEILTLDNIDKATANDTKGDVHETSGSNSLEEEGRSAGYHANKHGQNHTPMDITVQTDFEVSSATDGYKSSATTRS